MREVTIERLGAGGDGVAENGTLFVPFTLPGERAYVELETDGKHARLVELIEPSPDRIGPICPHFGTCGGCALQHLATARYPDWKRALVTEALAKAGLDAAVDDLIDAHGDGRRRAVFHARRGTH